MTGHDEWIERVTAHLEGSFEGEELKSLMDHMGHCEECQAYYDFSRDLEHAMSADVPVPADFTSRVLDALPSLSLRRSILSIMAIGWAFFAILIGLSALFPSTGYGFPFMRGMPGTLYFNGLIGAFMFQNILFLVFYGVALFLLYALLVRVRSRGAAVALNTGISGRRNS
jgi:hypothetical protein